MELDDWVPISEDQQSCTGRRDFSNYHYWIETELERQRTLNEWLI
jgi:hypothetical protein